MRIVLPEWSSNRFALAAPLLLAALSASVAVGGLYETNLLSNPSFEDYYTDAGVEWQSGSSVQYALQLDNTTDRGVQPWFNVSARVCSIRTDGPGSGFSGNHYGMGGRFSGGVGEQAVMRQDIDLRAVGFDPAALDNGELELEAGAYLSSWPGDDDSVGFSVVLLDAALQLISTPYATGQQAHDAWTLYQSGRLPIPVGTRFIRFEVTFTKVAGTNNDGRIDDAWMIVRRPVAPAPMVGRNLLANPGFESGAHGWAPIVGNARARLSGLSGVNSAAGAFLLFGGQRALGENMERSVVMQDIYLDDYGFTAQVLGIPGAVYYLQAHGWLYSFTNVGQARYTVKVYDALDNLLVEYDSGRVRSDRAPAPFHFQTPLPAAAARIAFTYDAVDPAGTNLDGYLDETVVVIEVTPHIPMFNGPQIVAHRGNSIVAPENTAASMHAAGAAGAQLAELDGRVSATGEIVLMHDASVDRTTDGTGNVAQLTLAQLAALDAGSWFSSDFAGEPVPTLADALAILLADSVTPLVEQKAGDAAAYVAELLAAGAVDKVVVQSFDWAFLDAVNQMDSNIVLAALGSGALTSAEVQAAQNAGASIMAWARGDVGAGGVELVHDAGLQLYVWTVNNPTEMASFVALGVDGIITDNPAGLAWIATPSSPPLGDFNSDGFVDLLDYNPLAACLQGPSLALTAGCEDKDLDGDGDADVADYMVFQQQFGIIALP